MTSAQTIVLYLIPIALVTAAVIYYVISSRKKQAK
jgi:cytochrome c-type biogenesis protein CcmH/NrfF